MQILIVDDDMATVDVIQNTVQWEKLGICGVHTAYNIEAAKKILKEKQVDIIISDIEMPQGSGIDLLTWFREQQMEGEFLLLTCHERFDYANHAVKLHAAEYLLKPFDVTVMEAALKKIILKIQEERALKEISEYGKWAKKNRRKLQIAFWDNVLTGRISQNEKELREEAAARNLDTEISGSYRLVVSKVTDVEKDKGKMNPELLFFVMENIHSEMLCGNPENESVLCYDYKNHYVLVTICTEETEGRIKQQCKALIEGFKNLFSASITCCISKPCSICEFYEVYHRNLQLIDSNVMYYGSSFLENEGIRGGSSSVFLLELGHMEEFLNEKKKLEFLSCMKEKISDMVREHTLNEQGLRQVKQEILQVIYTYLGKKEIQTSELFMEESLKELAEKATQSVTDIMRWTNFLIERTFAYEEEIQKKYTIEDRINQYIREHYQENIGRNQIAEQFYLAPEYLSKMYKKKTGISLKDYINEYRVEQAKVLLEKGERVSDAAESVGFENFTYFSTMFKKYTGISPNQYRKK